MTLQPDPNASICTDWYLTTWDANSGIIVREIFLYNSCEIIGNGSAGTSTTVKDSINVLAKQFCDGLSEQQMQTINNTLNEYNTYNCATKYLSSYFKTSSTQFKFCIENVSGNAQYHPGQNNISFSTNYAASRVDILEHEIYHAYQDKLYPGGTLQYSRINGVAQAGFANIEFEQAVITDIMHGSTTAFDTYGTLEQREEYTKWINELTILHTSFPRFNATGTPAEVAAYNIFITKYNSFLSEFNSMPNNPYHSNTLNLVPQAIINLFNNIPLNCQ
ncbi:hypothetical protein [uncultured Pedobacter sp.]|uniref:hypothetical protein n=1 Tax=uncultured Pedobacter sp. TaxID=246139 RepID=UPI0025F4A8FF|nr:hypothetical protein [uncultured Pedobacter sp.]